jgi:TetR/AcrR family transcriptional repressor of nem operon
MARASRAQMNQNRLAIEAASARLFREQGLKGISVDELMAAAGLTHGGFYGHFESKDALAAIACANAFEQSAARWRERSQGRPDPSAALKAIVDAYLSLRSRDDPGDSCPATALAADVAREPAGKPIHETFTAGIQALLGVLQSLGEPGEAGRQRALVQLSTLVGALLLARATRADGISGDFLEAAQAEIVSPVKGPLAEGGLEWMEGAPPRVRRRSR